MSKYLRIDEIVASISKTHKFDIDILKFLNTSDIYSGKIININYLPLSQLKGQAKKTIKKNDILFSEIRPQNKRFAYVDFDETYDFVVSTKLMVLRNINPLVDNKYFYYFLTNDNMLSVLQTRAENRICSFPQITFDLLSDYKVRVPDINEQKRISSLLSSLDKKIELNNQINAELESMAKTLYDYWFVQFDFPDENGKPYKSSGGKMVYNSVLKREIPEGWNDGSLNDIGQIVGGSTPNTSEDQNYCKNGIPWITPNDLSNNRGNKFISRGNKDVSNLGMKSASLKKYPAGTILLSSRAPIGYMALARNEITTNQGFKSFIPNKGYASVFIYYSVLNSLKTIIQSSSGSTFKEISASVLKTIKIVLPAKNITLFFANNLASLLEKQNILEQENQNLVELRDFLIPMLMNGQVTIKE